MRCRPPAPGRAFASALFHGRFHLQQELTLERVQFGGEVFQNFSCTGKVRVNFSLEHFSLILLLLLNVLFFERYELLIFPEGFHSFDGLVNVVVDVLRGHGVEKRPIVFEQLNHLGLKIILVEHAGHDLVHHGLQLAFEGTGSHLSDHAGGSGNVLDEIGYRTYRLRCLPSRVMRGIVDGVADSLTCCKCSGWPRMTRSSLLLK